MSSRRAVNTGVDQAKLEAIKQGKKIKSETGATENKKVTVTKSGDKIIAVEKETDLTQIKAPPKPKKLEPRPRVEEKVIMTRKKVDYLDNFQYKETKEFRKIEKGSKVVHTRLSDPIGGSYEETSYQKITTTSGTGGAGDRTGSALRGGQKTTTTTTKTERTSANARSQSRGGPSESSATATKTMTSTTKVGRRGGAGGPTSTTTETTSKTTTTRTTRRGQ